MLPRFATFSYCLIAALLVLHNTMVDFFGAGFTHVPGVVSAALLVAVFLMLPRLDSRGQSVLALFVFLLLSTAASVMFSINVGSAFLDWVDYFKAFSLAFLMALAVRSYRDLRLISDVALFSLVVANLYAIFYFKSEMVIYDYGEELVRQSSVRGDPNDSAMVTLAGLPVAIYYASSARNALVRMFGFLSTAVLIAGIVVTSSRGGFLGAVAVFFMLLVVAQDKKVMFGIGSCVFLIGFIFVSPEYMERIGTLFTFSESGGSSSLYDRADLATQAIIVFVNNPILGVGPNNFRLASGGTHVPHNAYLQILTDFGFLGFLALIFVMSFVAKGLLRPRVESEGAGYFSAVLIGIVGMMVTMFFLSQAKSSVFWLYVGFGLTSYKLCRKGVGAIDIRASYG